MTKIQAIKEEFGEPFRDVIIGFATMGYSLRATAAILNVSNSYLDKLCKVYNLHKYFKSIMERRPECRGKGTPRPCKYTDEYLLALVRQYPSSVDFRKKAPVDHGTIYHRFGLYWHQVVQLANEQQVYRRRNDSNRTEIPR